MAELIAQQGTEGPTVGLEKVERDENTAASNSDQTSGEAEKEKMLPDQDAAQMMQTNEGSLELDELKQKNEHLLSSLMESKAKSVALLLGVPEERIPFLIQLSDLKSINAAEADSEGEIKGALKAVLDQIPEWRKTKEEASGGIGGTGSVGAFRRDRNYAQSGASDTVAREQFRRGLR